jgi:alpha-mannosidase
MNNYWHTNYQASQGGDYTFRFALTSRAHSDRVASVRMGWEASNPLLAAPVQLRAGGPLPATSASFLDVAEPNVIVLGAKRPEEGNGLVVRLWELSGKATTAHLRVGAAAGIPGWPAARKATACTLVEAPGQALPIRDGTVTVPLGKFGLATVRIE